MRSGIEPWDALNHRPSEQVCYLVKLVDPFPQAEGLVNDLISQEAFFAPTISNLSFNEVLTLPPDEASVLLGPQKPC